MYSYGQEQGRQGKAWLHPSPGFPHLLQEEHKLVLFSPRFNTLQVLPYMKEPLVIHLTGFPHTNIKE